MSDELDWLPEQLDWVALRITRADECTYELAQALAQWSFEGPLELVQHRRGDRYG